jgi:hypothetical protein
MIAAIIICPREAKKGAKVKNPSASIFYLPSPYIGFTFSAAGPFFPWAMSKLTR